MNISVCLWVAICIFATQSVYAKLPTTDMVDEQVAFFSSAETPDKLSIDKLHTIKETQREIGELQRENAELQLLSQQAPERKIALQKKLQEVIDGDFKVISGSTLPAEIEQNVATERARNNKWVAQLAQLKKQLQVLLEEQETLPIEIAEQEQHLNKQIKDNKIAQELIENKIDQWVIDSGQKLQEEKLKGLVLQQDTLVQRRELAKINAQILEAKLTLSNKKIELFQVRLLKISTQSSLRVIEKAKQLSRGLVDAPAAIQQWNIKNELLAVEFEALNRQLLLTQQARQKLEAQRLRISQNLLQIKANIKWLKSSPAFSDAINSQLLLLPDLSDKSDLAKAITAAHLKHFKLSSELAKLKDIPTLIDNMAIDFELNSLHKKVLLGVLDFRYEVLTNALEKTDQFIAEITRLDALQDQFATEIQEDRDFLREKQLFLRDRSALWELSNININSWFGTANLSGRMHKLWRNSALYKGEVLLLILLFLLIFALIVQLRKIENNYRLIYAKVIGKVRKDTFYHTFILLLLAASCGGLISSCLYLTGHWIELRLGSFYSYDLKNIFTSACVVVSLWESLLIMAMPEGVLQLHFGFSKKGRQWLKLTLSKQRWLLYSLLLIILTSEMLAEKTQSPLLRFVFIILILWLIVFINRLLKRLLILLPFFVKSPSVMHSLRLLFILPLIAIGILAALGYFYASWVALFYYYSVLFSFGFSALLQRLGVRWLKIEQRRISLQRALEKREEQLLRDKTIHTSDEIDDLVLPVEEISEQSLTLLNLVVVIFLFVMLSTLLSDSLLALQWMNKVTIWEVVTPTDTGNIIEIISLKAALSALIIFSLSLFSAKNLPGLLELLVLHRLNITKGTAYATTTLLRYLIVLGGLLIAISTLGFNWSRLQWLVAALSVGLGFGLQEIFANFVSGIILLFERPLRVGDTITIQNLTGVVTRINTRATTILDWDKKEIVVPNKSLITDQLINWSLSDAMTRIIIPIGVAYGSDVQLVKSLLVQAAMQCKEINSEPAPEALFTLFGASSLDFELRVFVSQLEGRSAIKDELNTSIEQLFRLHNIEIPFPQMDLHIRELPTV